MMKKNGMLNNDSFLLAGMNFILSIVLFFNYSSLNDALQVAHKSMQVIGGGWWFILVGWVIFLKPLFLFTIGWTLAIIICVLAHRLTASSVLYLQYLTSFQFLYSLY